ncbi:MAG: hypothetical protein WDZ83_11080 [Rhizobiaceae bacterium]
MTSFSTCSYRVAFASVALALAAIPATAKEYDIRGQNRATYAAKCKPNPNCIDWGGGVFTTGDTKVICTKRKCTMYEDDAPAREVPTVAPTQDAAEELR